MKEPIELTINELLNGKDDAKYLIPLYQRNYAWEEKEIEQLLQDIIDKSSDIDSKYYLGTLIVDEKIRNNETIFEIIDGQQRHTTLTLINAYINFENTKKSNLFYEARPEVEKYLESIFKFDNSNYHVEIGNSINTIKQGFDIIKKFFKSKKDLKEQEINENEFRNYFENKTVIIRVNVPKDTDINHYFEVMNTRGIQLEKHQILKAAFIEKIKDNENISILFGRIWDACSNMENYIQYNFDSNLRKNIFGENLTNFPIMIEDMILGIRTNDTLLDSSLLAILSSDIKKENIDNEKNNSSESKYSSIIDFPNFLLQVLKLHDSNKKVSLDDKNLLNSFGYATENELPNSIEFINSLLKYRTLFDRYFIKRELNNSGENNWIIRKPANKDDDYLINTFEKEDNDKIKMIQSMFQVSYPTNSYKNWLLDALKFFKDDKIDINSNAFYDAIFRIATTNYSKNTDWEYNGVGISNFTFNYLDFILWLNQEKIVIKNEYKKLFDSFKFSQRTSVEHVFAQKNILLLNADSEYEREKTLNSFGNLCLINNGSNSKYSDYYFDAKKQQFEERKNVESLKQVLMFSYDTWNTEQIANHHREMLELLHTYSQ